MDYRVGDLWRAYLFELSDELSRDETWRAETALIDLLQDKEKDLILLWQEDLISDKDSVLYDEPMK